MPTYENLITAREVSIAIENIMIAPQGTAWSPTRVNQATPPTGFTFVGGVVEESPQLALTRERFQLRTGIPQVLQYQAVRAVGGQFSMGFHSNSNRLAQYGLGNFAPVKTLLGNTAALLTNTTEWTNAAATVTANSTTPGFEKRLLNIGTPQLGTFGWVAGQVLSAGLDFASTQTGNIEAEIQEINYGSPGWVLFSYPGFDTTVGATHRLGRISMTALGAGTNRIASFHLLGFADFLDGVQVVHDMQYAEPTGEWTETIRPDGNAQVMATFELRGYSVSRYGTTNQLVVAERFYFPKL